jgi:hypothetical protein
MISSLELGFAVSSTDAGHSSKIEDSSSATWAMIGPGNVNWPLFLDFSYLAFHDMAKRLVKLFLGLL